MKKKTLPRKPASKVAPSEALKSLDARPLSTSRAAAPAESHKITFSLFGPDLDAMNQIIGTLWNEGTINASRSDALKIAFRYAAKKATFKEMREIYRDIKSEDGRSSGARGK